MVCLSKVANVKENENGFLLFGQIVSPPPPKFKPVMAHADHLMWSFQLHHILKSNVIAVSQDNML